MAEESKSKIEADYKELIRLGVLHDTFQSPATGVWEMQHSRDYLEEKAKYPLKNLVWSMNDSDQDRTNNFFRVVKTQEDWEKVLLRSKEIAETQNQKPRSTHSPVLGVKFTNYEIYINSDINDLKEEYFNNKFVGMDRHSASRLEDNLHDKLAGLNGTPTFAEQLVIWEAEERASIAASIEAIEKADKIKRGILPEETPKTQLSKQLMVEKLGNNQISLN